MLQCLAKGVILESNGILNQQPKTRDLTEKMRKEWFVNLFQHPHWAYTQPDFFLFLFSPKEHFLMDFLYVFCSPFHLNETVLLWLVTVVRDVQGGVWEWERESEKAHYYSFDLHLLLNNVKYFFQFEFFLLSLLSRDFITRGWMSWMLCSSCLWWLMRDFFFSSCHFFTL